jgi:hypothetical protein
VLSVPALFVVPSTPGVPGPSGSRNGVSYSPSMGHRGVDLGGFSVTPTLAGHFRVIAPDTRGHGRTAHPGGSIPYTQLADDVVGLMTATIVGMRHPGSVRAIVNHAGYDTLDPQARACR